MDMSRIALPVLPANEQELAEHRDLLLNRQIQRWENNLANFCWWRKKLCHNHQAVATTTNWC